MSSQFFQPTGHGNEGHVVTEGVAPTAVAERVSDDDDVEDVTFKYQTRDGYCQCKDRALPPQLVDRKPTNLPRSFRAIQRSMNASNMVPRPLRSASVDRHADGRSGTGLGKYHGGAVVSRHNGSNAYRVSSPTDLVVLRGQARSTRRRRRTPPPTEMNQVRVDSAAAVKRPTAGTAPHAAVDSDLASDMSDLDQDIVDDLHLAESAASFTGHSQPSHQNGWIPAQSDAVIRRRSSAQDQTRADGVTGAPRTQRAGSYHGSVHHSITLSEFPTSMSNSSTNRSPVGSLKNALVNFAGRWSRSGRKTSASKSDLSTTEDGHTGCVTERGARQSGCVADHGAGLMSRIVARASCRLPKNRSKSGERCADEGPSSVAVSGGRVTVSAVCLRHDELRSSSKTTTTTTIHGEGPVSGLDDESVNADQLHVPYIDDSESECS